MITIKNDFKERNILKIVPGVTKVPELVDLSKLGDNYRLGYLEREDVEEDFEEIIKGIVDDASEYNRNNDPDWFIQKNGFIDNYLHSFIELKQSLENRVREGLLYEEDAKREYLNSFNSYLPILALILCKLEDTKIAMSGFIATLSWRKDSFPFFYPCKEENGELRIDLDEIYEKEEPEEEKIEEKSIENSPVSYDAEEIRKILEEVLDEKLEKIKNDIIKTIKIDKLNELGNLVDDLSKIPAKEDALQHIIAEKDNEISYLKGELSKNSSDKEIIELRREIRELKEDKENRLVLADEVVKHKLKEKDKEIAKLKEEHKIEIEKLEEEHKKEEEKLTKFKEDSLKRVNDENFKLLGDVNEWKKKAESYLEELNSIKEELEAKETEENSVSDAKIEELTNQLNESNSINDELRNQIKSMTEEDNTMKIELGESKRKVIELEASIRHLTEDKENYERRIKELTDRENSLKQELNNLKSSINNNGDTNRLEEIEKENSLLRGSINTLNSRIEKLQNENLSLRQANDQANVVQNDSLASRVYNNQQQEKGPKTYNVGGKQYTEEELKNTPQYQRLQSLLRPAKK